jgi:DNA repair protein RecO (recombination protein O)
MPRNLARTQAIVLRVRRMGETSKLVTLYTEDFGKVKVVAKGARKPKSKFGAGLELMTEIQVVFYLREDRELQTLSDCDVTRSHPRLLTALQRLSYGSAACELVDRATLEGEGANKRLFRCLGGVLAGLEEVSAPQSEALFWYFQLRMAETLGYRPELGHCVSCLGGLEARSLWFSPAFGGGLCSRCGTNPDHAGDGGEQIGENGAAYGAQPSHAFRVDGDSIRFLAGLQSLPKYDKDTIPEALPRQRGREIRSMLLRFLEFHAGQCGRLKSLEFLESMKG